MYYSPVRHSSPKWSVRLACIRHAASVHPEPGSNSPLSYFFQTTLVCLALFYFFNLIDVVFYSFLFSFQCPLTWLSRRVPIYITISSFFCKAFSLSFFIFFPVCFLFPLCIDVFYPSLFLPFFLFWLIYTVLLQQKKAFSVAFLLSIIILLICYSIDKLLIFYKKVSLKSFESHIHL